MTMTIRRSFAYTCLTVVALCLLSPPAFKLVLAQTLNPKTGKTVEILGIESKKLQTKLESGMIKMLKSDDFDGVTELVRQYPMDVDHALTTDLKLVYRMVTPINKTKIDSAAALSTRLSSLAKMIDEDD